MLHDILVPLAALGGIGLLLGLLLAFASKKFEVEVDLRELEIRALLAGANCGGCGYPGCNGFAAALVAGGAKVDACPATPKENVKKIAGILGIEAEPGEASIARVRCKGGSNCKDNFEYKGVKTCAGAKLVAGGPKGCAWGCIGFGDCVSACKFDALHINENGVAEVDPEKCVGCKQCVATCPVSIIQMVPKSAPVAVTCMNQQKGKDIRPICTKACIGCGLCVKQCEFGAITVVNNVASIDYDKCTGCLACAKKCPTNAISILVENETEASA